MHQAGKDPGGHVCGLLAVRQEMDAILAELVLKHEARSRVAIVREGVLRGKRVVAAEIGIGKVNAAAATQMLIDRYAPNVLLFTGSAGSLSADLRVGDIVVATAAAVHDAGLHRDNGFTARGYSLLDTNGEHCCARLLHPSSSLLKIARRVAERRATSLCATSLLPAVHFGVVATGDQMILSAEKKEWLHGTLGAVAVEQEGAAFAQVAEMNGVPWLLIRAVSDTADHRADFAFELWMEYVDDLQTPRAWVGRALDRVSYLLANPNALGRVRRFLTNIRRAANNAASLTAAIVEELEGS